MTHIRAELRQLWRSWIWRGAALVVLGLAAMAWPERFVGSAMLAVGVVAILFGAYEISIAVTIRGRATGWWLAGAHGTAVLLFGVMTVVAPMLSLRASLAVIAAWLLIYAGVALGGAITAWRMRAARWTLLMWAAVDVALAVTALLTPEGAIFALIFGAAYAVLFGVWQIASGLWLRQTIRRTAAEPETEAPLAAPSRL